MVASLATTTLVTIDSTFASWISVDKIELHKMSCAKIWQYTLIVQLRCWDLIIVLYVFIDTKKDFMTYAINYSFS